MSNLVETLRRKSVEDMFQLSSFSNAWGVWRNLIHRSIGDLSDPLAFLNLGDNLKNIFQRTSSDGRSQSTLSAAGTAWECLVSWYLNLCLIGSRAVVIRQKRRNIPSPVRQAIAVNYDSFRSNSEADLIALLFPNERVFTDEYDPEALDIDDTVGRYFSDFEIGILQCKTNWNDSAQIPMLWDMVYSSDGFGGRNITLGNSAYSIRDLEHFFYSFITVPTSRGPFRPNSTNVLRVKGISGGNFWGQPSESSVANSIKEIFGRNFRNAFDIPQRETLREKITHLDTDFSYFSL